MGEVALGTLRGTAGQYFGKFPVLLGSPISGAGLHVVALSITLYILRHIRQHNPKQIEEICGSPHLCKSFKYINGSICIRFWKEQGSIVGWYLCMSPVICLFLERAVEQNMLLFIWVVVPEETSGADFVDI